MLLTVVYNVQSRAEDTTVYVVDLRSDGETYRDGCSVSVRNDEWLRAAGCFYVVVLVYDEAWLVGRVFFPLTTACCFAFCFGFYVLAIYCCSYCLCVFFRSDQ